MMISRRNLLTAALAAPIIGGLNMPAAQARSNRMTYRFLSTPDFFNTDVADLRELPNWNQSKPNGINNHWRKAIDTTFASVCAERPDSVFVAGDLVEGHWDKDTDNVQMFGPVETLDQCKRAITKASNVYYPFWKQIFASRGLTVYPALGDHEIGDDLGGNRPLDDRWPVRSRKYKLVDTFKQRWAAHFTDNGTKYSNRPTGGASDTAYAVDLGPNLRLITVDMFCVTSHGVTPGVYYSQLRWLEAQIKQAKGQGRIVIVQGHVPVLWPVRLRYSGGLRVPGGTKSEFYKVMRRTGVDLFLCGEVHDETAIQYGTGPVQISHGCIFPLAFNYLVGEVFADGTVKLTSKSVPRIYREGGNRLWCSDMERSPAEIIRYADAPVVDGTMTLKNHSIIERSGRLDVYRP